MVLQTKSNFIDNLWNIHGSLTFCNYTVCVAFKELRRRKELKNKTQLSYLAAKSSHSLGLNAGKLLESLQKKTLLIYLENFEYPLVNPSIHPSPHRLEAKRQVWIVWQGFYFQRPVIGNDQPSTKMTISITILVIIIAIYITTAVLIWPRLLSPLLRVRFPWDHRSV